MRKRGMNGRSTFADLDIWEMQGIKCCLCTQILASLNIGAWAYMMLPIGPGQANPMLQASLMLLFCTALQVLAVVTRWYCYWHLAITCCSRPCLSEGLTGLGPGDTTGPCADSLLHQRRMLWHHRVFERHESCQLDTKGGMTCGPSSHG